MSKLELLRERQIEIILTIDRIGGKADDKKYGGKDKHNEPLKKIITLMDNHWKKYEDIYEEIWRMRLEDDEAYRPESEMIKKFEKSKELYKEDFESYLQSVFYLDRSIKYPESETVSTEYRVLRIQNTFTEMYNLPDFEKNTSKITKIEILMERQIDIHLTIERISKMINFQVSTCHRKQTEPMKKIIKLVDDQWEKYEKLYEDIWKMRLENNKTHRSESKINEMFDWSRRLYENHYNRYIQLIFSLNEHLKMNPKSV